MGNTFQKTDQQIVTAFKNNDQNTMEKVYKNVFPKFKSHVFKNSGNEAEAKDVFQEAFVSCWRNVKKNMLREDSDLEAYLFTIAKNKWTDHLRSSRFKKTVLNDGVINLHTDNENAYDEVEEGNKLSALHIALKQIGASCKQLLKQFYFERKSMEEIALELELESASVRNKKYRCMEKLRALALDVKKNG